MQIRKLWLSNCEGLNQETFVGALEWNFIIQRAFKIVFVSCMVCTTGFAIAIVSDVTNTLDDTAFQ